MYTSTTMIFLYPFVLIYFTDFHIEDEIRIEWVRRCNKQTMMMMMIILLETYLLELSYRLR